MRLEICFVLRDSILGDEYDCRAKVDVSIADEEVEILELWTDDEAISKVALPLDAGQLTTAQREALEQEATESAGQAELDLAAFNRALRDDYESDRASDEAWDCAHEERA